MHGAKAVIDQNQAIRQLERLSGLDYFPKDKPARRELMLALQCAITEDIAAQVVTDWLAESGECPKPANLRHNINSRQEALVEQRRRCDTCGGSGFVTRYYLATYHCFSWGQLRGCQRLDGYEAALTVTEGLRSAYASPTPPTMAQQVISAAAECGCRRG